MNEMEFKIRELNKLGFETKMVRNQNPDGTLSDVDLYVKKVFDTMNICIVAPGVEELKEILPKYHSISVTISNYNKSISLEASWHPDNPKFNPKTLKDVKLVPHYCPCPMISE